jgi:SAM-dependent methyltransferase
MRTQDQTFIAGEADRWYERNRHVLERLDDRDVPLRLVELYGLKPKSVLEIGAANGYRVAEISRRTGARAVAIEPSAKAVADGRARFQHVEFHQGEARRVPVDGQFDLVIVNFVLHWIDRRNLLACVAEIDRLTADGGHLLVGDFHPWQSAKVQYHHLADAEMYTFKQDYSRIFVASELYQPVGLLTSDARALESAVPDDRRDGTWLLRKRLEGRHTPKVFTPK